MMTKNKQFGLAVFICMGLGTLFGAISGSGPTAWYEHLAKPNFLPPDWVFGPVWIFLYTVLAGILVSLYNLRDKEPILFRLFILQFILNLTWSPLFFHFHRIDSGLYCLSTLLFISGILLIKLWKHKNLFFLFSLYYLWLCFAWLLNYKIWMLN
jgi:benzodiazapine receptor